MNTTIKRLGVLTAGVVVAVSAAACGTSTSTVAGGTPNNVQFIVDTGPGGGSDLFARQLIKIARDNKVLTDNWPVIAKPEGGGLGAMAFLKGKPGDSNFISAFTSKWIIAGLSAKTAPATLSELTPIVMLADEIQVIAAPVDAPFNTMAEFLEAAKGNPGEMVQTGGSPNSVDNLVALEIEKNTNTKWKYLSFEDGAPRITAMLRGDAQIDIGAIPDFADQIDAGKLKLIGVFADKRVPDFPNVPTIAEQGIDLGEFPDHLQFRGIAGPPKMSAEAVKYYQDFFQKVAATDAWKDYLRTEGFNSEFVVGDDLTKQINDFTDAAKPLVAGMVNNG
ncbi:MAG: tripartite tricarboxylate transporter substrate binding protein [Mycobacterium sp.]